MKHVALFSLLFLFVGLALISCDSEDESLDMRSADTRLADHNGRYRIEDWGGDPRVPCAWNGLNCMVIIEDLPERALAEAGDWGSFFDNGLRTYGLDNDLVEGVMNGEVEVYKMYEGDELHLGLK